MLKVQLRRFTYYKGPNLFSSLLIMAPLVELDALEILVIVDNEVDPISTYRNPALKVSGQFIDIGLRSQTETRDRGDASKEVRMDSICCGAHGLSLMIVRHISSKLTCIT